MSPTARSIAFITALTLPARVLLTAQSPAATPPADSVREWIDQVLATGATPGVAVAVVRRGSVLLARGVGTADLATGQPVTDSTRFYIGSTTKAFTALTATTLGLQGRLRVEAPLGSLLPKVQLHEGLSPSAITLRDLLAMRSGIGEGPVVLRTAYTGEFTTPELLALLREHPPASTGRAFRYSNIGYNVAGMVLERRFGRPWHEVVRETVLEPLGMSSTTARLSTVPTYQLAMPHEFVDGQLARIALLKSERTMHAAGGHVATAGDLARFLTAQLNAGRVPGEPGIPAAAIRETHRRTVGQERTFSFVRRIGWGLGWDIASYRGMTLFQRNGGFSGYYSHFSFIPERGVGVAVVANGGLDGAASEAVAEGVYDLLLGRRDLAALAGLRDSLAGRVARARTSSRQDAAAARVLLPHPPAYYFGVFRNASLGTLTLEGNSRVLVARLGDSWGVAHGVAGADGSPVADALVANVLGDQQRFTLRLTSDQGSVREVVLDEFVFRRVDAPAPTSAGAP